MTPMQGEGGRSGTATSIQWAALVLVVLLAVAVVAALAEGAVRLRQWMKYGTPKSFAAMYDVDPALNLRVLKAGFDSSTIHINSLGFRGPEITRPKPEGTVRIAFLGASTTFCGEVSGDAAVWPQKVTEQLRRDFPAVRFDFVNAGVPGYLVKSTRLNLKHKLAALQPDIIVVYHLTNDLSGEVRDLAVARGLPGAADIGQQSWLETHSLLWELVLKNLRVMQAQRTAPLPDAQHLQVDARELGRGFEGDLSGLLQDASAVSSRVVVATFSTRLRAEQTPQVQLEAAASAFVYMPFMSIDGLLAGYARYNEIIGKVARAEGALLIGGENSIPGDAAHFVDSVHFSDAGSRAMATRVHAALVADAKVLEMVRARSAK